MQDLLESLASTELTCIHGGHKGYVAGDIPLNLEQLQCLHDAKSGMPGSSIVHRVPMGGYYFVVISAGSGDPMRLASNLERRRAGGGVLRIAPVNARARSVVEPGDGDHVVTLTELARRMRRFAH
jgi:hypothetical protein